MRRLTVILTAALVAAAVSAQLQWKETAWDFGIINEADGKVAHRFAYRNGGADTGIKSGGDDVVSGELIAHQISLCIPTREPHSCR